jgi:hypothetical protein
MSHQPSVPSTVWNARAAGQRFLARERRGGPGQELRIGDVQRAARRPALAAVHDHKRLGYQGIEGVPPRGVGQAQHSAIARLARAEHAARLVRRPTLTAPARDDMGEARVGTKERLSDRTKELMKEVRRRAETP